MKYNQNKGLSLIELILIVIIIAVVIILGYNLLDNNKSKDDVYKMLDDILAIHNISYEEYSSEGKYSKKYLKDNMQKIVEVDKDGNVLNSVGSTYIGDYKNNTNTFYNENDKTGHIVGTGQNEKTYPTYIYDYIIASMKQYSYNISTETLEGKTCIVATVKGLKNQSHYDSLSEFEKKLYLVRSRRFTENIF